MSDKHITLEFSTEVERQDGSIATSTVTYQGDRSDFLWLCKHLPGFAASAFVRSMEKVCAQYAEGE